MRNCCFCEHINSSILKYSFLFKIHCRKRLIYNTTMVIFYSNSKKNFCTIQNLLTLDNNTMLSIISRIFIRGYFFHYFSIIFEELKKSKDMRLGFRSQKNLRSSFFFQLMQVLMQSDLNSVIANE